MLAFGAGGLDVAVAMGGGEYYITMPKMIKVNLTGKLSPWVSAKDVSLEILRILSVKGGVGYIIEWGGEGIKTLSVPERATITNMGTELGATTSIFPSDEITREFLKAQGREEDYTALASDADAVYDRVIKIDLSAMGRMLLMALIGLIITTVINMFVASSGLHFLICVAGVLIFAALTAYDTQKIKMLAMTLDTRSSAGKLAVLGALTLYLDFINLFLYLLQLFGRRR